MLNESTAAWLGLAALAIGAVVRLLKADRLNAVLASFGVPPIPKRALPWVAVGLGVAGAAVAALQAGKPWAVVLVDAFNGAIAGAVAIAGHELVVESARDGKELAAPKTPPGPSLVLVLALAGVLSACSVFQSPANVARLKVLEKMSCILLNVALPDAKAIAAACDLAPELTDDVAEVVAEHKAATAREMRKAGVCAPPPNASLYLPAPNASLYRDAAAASAGAPFAPAFNGGVL